MADPSCIRALTAPGRKPRLFLIFCCLISVALGAMSSLLLYYPDSNVTVVPPVFHPSARFGDTGSGRLVFGDGANSGGRYKNYFEANEEEYEAAPGVENSGKIRHQVHHVEEEVLGSQKGEQQADAANSAADKEISELNVTVPMEELVATTVSSNVINTRLIHFDLKGAPPKVYLLKEVLKLAKSSGITGVLIEWEDTFPWTGILANTTLIKGGYSMKDVEEIVEYAEKTLNMEVIPLIQTFGHVEYILKSEEFKHLREVEEDPQSFCPLKPGTMDVIEEMLNQILKVHGNSKFVHIGCDEVYNLHLCPVCRETYSSKDELFLDHVVTVAKLVRSRNKVPIIWDDMLRSVAEAKLVASGIGHLVEPMVWVYAEDVDRFVGYEAWDKYSKVFPTIWAAGAFKGAFGETLVLPPINRHGDNVQRWVNVLTRESPRWQMGLGGLVLTGWQRYDHFAVLCELMPAAIPSMVYTSLILSTPKGSEVIRNRVFVLKNSTSVNAAAAAVVTTEKTMSSAEVSQKFVLEPTDTPDSSTAEVSSESTSARSKRSANKRAKIPHPRSLMRKGDGTVAQFGGGGVSIHRDRLELGDKNLVVSKRFQQVLRCTSRLENLQSVMKEDGDTELSFAARCTFPGVAFFRTLFRLRSLLDEIWDLQTKVMRGRAWATPYNVRHNYSLPSRVDEVIFTSVPRLKRILSMTAKTAAISLKTVYPAEVVLEWIEQNLWEAWQILDSFEKVGERLKRVGVWPRRPLPSPPGMVDSLGLRAANLFDHDEF